MRILASCIALIGCSLAFSQDQPAATQPTEVRMSARDQVVEGSIVHLNGKVEISAIGFLLQADEATYHTDTGEIEARGNVRMKTDQGEVRGSEVRWKPATPPSRATRALDRAF